MSATRDLMTDPVFYSLPPSDLEVGMSTDDGQDIVELTPDEDGWIFADVYTPCPDDPEQDESNREHTVCRPYRPGKRVSLAVFPDTDTDGSEYPNALPGK